MDAALNKIKQLAAEGETSRQQLMLALHKLAQSFEDTNDTIHRYGHANLQTAAVKTGIDLGLFKQLAKAVTSLTVEEIARKNGADTALNNRLLRFLASTGAVDEITKGRYTANHVTKNLAEELAEAGISHYFGTVSPIYQALPAFLRGSGYQDPTDELHTAFQKARNTEMHVFEWFSQSPGELEAFNNYMALRREPEVSWLTVYPLLEETKNWDTSKPVFVNIGGGVGHQCAQLKEKYPALPGRVILQDLPHSIAQALPTPGVENMVHKFFEPQPIQGAKIYHLRGVLHNHPPHKIRQLLENTKSAMTQDSILLLDEMILPETGLNSNAASIDMAMLGAFAAMERTEAQWRQTLQDTGLVLVKTYRYYPLSYETVMDVRLPRV